MALSAGWRGLGLPQWPARSERVPRSGRDMTNARVPLRVDCDAFVNIKLEELDGWDRLRSAGTLGTMRPWCTGMAHR